MTSSVCTAVLAWQHLKVDYFKLMSLFWMKFIIWVISHVALFGKKLYAILLLLLIMCVHVILLFSYFHHIVGHILSKGSPAHMLVSYCCKSWWISRLDKSGNCIFHVWLFVSCFLYSELYATMWALLPTPSVPNY